MLVGKSFARQKFDALIASQSTEYLIEMLRALNLNTTSEGIFVTSEISCELEQRLPEPEFLELMNELDMELATCLDT
jgi:hypothetical protein